MNRARPHSLYFRGMRGRRVPRVVAAVQSGSPYFDASLFLRRPTLDLGGLVAGFVFAPLLSLRAGQQERSLLRVPGWYILPAQHRAQHVLHHLFGETG